MTEIVAGLFSSQTIWVWVGVGVVLLAIEIPLTTGWLLAPAVCAFMMAALQVIGVQMAWPWQLTSYAVFTIVMTLIWRAVRPNLFSRHTTPDINDRTGSLIGKTGQAVAAFQGGRGRVLVDGAEWEAETEAGDAPAAGGAVEVVRVLGGAKLAVRPV
jgi:membrane protein implicated in regulation of membrane protease activity